MVEGDIEERKEIKERVLGKGIVTLVEPLKRVPIPIIPKEEVRPGTAAERKIAMGGMCLWTSKGSSTNYWIKDEITGKFVRVARYSKIVGRT